MVIVTVLNALSGQDRPNSELYKLLFHSKLSIYLDNIIRYILYLYCICWFAHILSIQQNVLVASESHMRGYSKRRKDSRVEGIGVKF